MFQFFKRLRNSLVSKLILAVGITFLLSMSAWAFFSIRYQKDSAMEDILQGADRLANTIVLGTHYAMMTILETTSTRSSPISGNRKRLKTYGSTTKQDRSSFPTRSMKWAEKRI